MVNPVIKKEIVGNKLIIELHTEFTDMNYPHIVQDKLEECGIDVTKPYESIKAPMKFKVTYIQDIKYCKLDVSEPNNEGNGDNENKEPRGNDDSGKKDSEKNDESENSEVRTNGNDTGEDDNDNENRPDNSSADEGDIQEDVFSEDEQTGYGEQGTDKVGEEGIETEDGLQQDSADKGKESVNDNKSTITDSKPNTAKKAQGKKAYAKKETI